MKRVIYKSFTIGGFEKEEQWINEMADQGLLLTDVGFCKYVFEEGNSGEYIYRLELLEELPAHPASQAYIKNREESGVEQVASLFRWVYFRKKKAEGEFELFADAEARIKHYTRINTLCYMVMIIQIMPMLSNLTLHTHRSGGLSLGLGVLNLVVLIWIAWITRGIRKNIRDLQRGK